MTERDPLSPDTPVDLSNCEREPIHILGRVQSYGCLMALNSEWLVVHASTNTGALMGLEAETLIGEPIARIFPEATVHHLRTRMQVLSQDVGAARIFDVDLFDDGRRFDVSVHVSGRLFVFEFEPRAENGAGLLRDDAAVGPLVDVLEGAVLVIERHVRPWRPRRCRERAECLDDHAVDVAAACTGEPDRQVRGQVVR